MIHKSLYPSGHTCYTDIMHGTNLISGGSAKIKHSNAAQAEWWNIVMYLAPAWASGHNVCPHSTPQCAAECLDTAGRAAFDAKIPAARLRRTKFFYACKLCFLVRLEVELWREYRKALRLGRRLAIRLNGTSDLLWEHIARRLIVEVFGDCQWYDYTKYPYRLRPTHKLPTNYDLTYSRSEKTTPEQIAESLDNGRNVAVVFGRYKRTTNAIPAVWSGYGVINGDVHDLRFLEAGQGSIVGLNAKGRAIGAAPGFVVYA